MPKDIRLIRKKATGRAPKCLCFFRLSLGNFLHNFKPKVSVMPFVSIVLFRYITWFCLCRVRNTE